MGRKQKKAFLKKNNKKPQNKQTKNEFHLVGCHKTQSSIMSKGPGLTFPLEKSHHPSPGTKGPSCLGLGDICAPSVIPETPTGS